MEIKKLPKNKFPKEFFEIPQPPKNLWIMGELPSQGFVYLCVVGSRKFTSYGKEACEKIIAGLKGYPVVIVSGFALGIDTIAHKAALQAGLKTVIFPGSGLSKEAIHPKTNIHLIEEVIQGGGCLISEFEPNSKPTIWSFPMRNRLMAGISKAVLIIEAEERSGTLITARLATEYNRELLAVPGSIFSPNSKGTNQMIGMGATPVTSAKDVLMALGFEPQEPEEKQKNLLDDLSSEEKKVLALLREPITRDDLIRNISLPAQSVNAILSAMEIKGIIKEEMGEIRIA